MNDEWRDRAACIGQNPEWWADEWQMRPIAAQICYTCPVKRECLKDALRCGDVGVVRGGMYLKARDRRGVPQSLLCSHCKSRAVRATPTMYARYCSKGCEFAAAAKRLAFRQAGIGRTPLNTAR